MPSEMPEEARGAIGRLLLNPEVLVANPRLPIGSPDWEVLDADGRFLGVVTLPNRFEAMQFVGDAVYGVWRDGGWWMWSLL